MTSQSLAPEQKIQSTTELVIELTKTPSQNVTEEAHEENESEGSSAEIEISQENEPVND